ncbi:MAG: DUF4912 domain-containing protein [Stenomitos rutilans HA7619-LM2]|jgi:phosphate transport system substrate-binding protein|nr:DUF4912 domain-containing protein [Stenomitos rutilans HA7619-LM2]
MTRLRNQKTAMVSFSVLLVATIGGVTARPLIAAWLVNPVLAPVLGASAFPLPTSVPVGTVIRIGGSSGMETINQVLKRRFEQQFVGTDVVLNTQGTGPAIKDVLDGNADLAAIGRSLTEQEKAQGLVPVPVSRHKIAIIVGTQNPFKGDLTFEQFAKIFRGEIKDWSQLGGARGAIRFIDRPDSSDTRQAFRNYPVFKQARFVTGKTARQVAQDSTSQVIQALGTDGIGYAIADQLEGRGDVRVLTMHKTLPSNPKYPFSQPLIYVYKGPQPNPSAQAFLGFASAPTSRKTIETARKESTALLAANPEVASPTPKVSVPSAPAPKPSATAVPQAASPAPSNAPETSLVSARPWWWLLALPLLGGLFWWLLKDREGQFEPEEPLPESMEPDAPLEETIVPVPEIVPPLLGTQSTGRSRITLVPRDCTNAYVYWEMPTDEKEALQQQGARKLVLRLYEVTGVDLDHQPPVSLQEFDCDTEAHDRHLPIRTDDRDYLTELGYVAEDGRWLSVARSEAVHVPACLAPQPSIATDEPTPVSEPSPVLRDEGKTTDGAPLVDGGVAEDTAPEGDAGTRTMLADDRTYQPFSAEANHISLMPPKTADAYAYLDVVGRSKGDPGTTSTSFFSHEAARDQRHDRATEDSLAGDHQATSHEIFLVPRDRQSAYIHWKVLQTDKDALKHQGGQQLVLRIYDVMGTETASGYSMQQFLCNEWEQEQLVPIPVSNVDYVAELGYTTLDGRFLSLARSIPTRVPGA